MSAPTNQHLLQDYPTPEALMASRDANLEIWAVDTQFLVAAGTDMEQMVADLYDGNHSDPSVPTRIRAVSITKVSKLVPEPVVEQTLTNPYLIRMFSAKLEPMVDPTTELWSVTTQYLVDAGTDVQQMFVDNVQGKFMNNDPKMSPACKAICPISDIVKVK